jgi:Glycosyltransferase WbsX
VWDIAGFGFINNDNATITGCSTNPTGVTVAADRAGHLTGLRLGTRGSGCNESWTRTWIDTDSDVLLVQRYDPQDIKNFIIDLIPAFRDRRYIKIDEKPLLLVYRVDIIPNIQQVADSWRRTCETEGLKGLFLAAIQNIGIGDPRPYNFDAAVDYPPHNHFGDDALPSYSASYTNPDCRGWAFDYERVIRKSLNRPIPDYVLFRGAVPSWDNTACRVFQCIAVD